MGKYAEYVVYVDVEHADEMTEAIQKVPGFIEYDYAGTGEY